MKKKNHPSLGLLDDSFDPSGFDAPAKALVELTRSIANQATAKRTAPQPAPNTATNVRQAPAVLQNSNRVFRDRPTLRQMMREYNRRSSTPALIKQGQRPNLGNKVDFHFDKVDLIRMPLIPGKILRPTKETPGTDES